MGEVPAGLALKVMGLRAVSSGGPFVLLERLFGTRKRVRKRKCYAGRRNLVSLFGMITKMVCSYVRKLPCGDTFG